VHYLVPERARGLLVDAGAVEIDARELGELVQSRTAAAAAFPAPAQREPEPVYVDVPVYDGDPPLPRQRWNPTLGRHAWARLAEHWYRCLFCGVHKWKRPGTGAKWYAQWGYREWPADRWGTTRDGADFPRCPGPGRRVPG
jgi:murein DD-endopeptidase MepM/ murein hydrolase activator NlpD